jgi:hypothetical protein
MDEAKDRVVLLYMEGEGAKIKHKLIYFETFD